MRSAMLLVLGVTFLALVVVGTAGAEQWTAQDQAVGTPLDAPAASEGPETEGPMTAPADTSDSAEAGDAAGEPSAEVPAGEAAVQEPGGELREASSPAAPTPEGSEAEVADAAVEVPQEAATAGPEPGAAEVPADAGAAAEAQESLAAADQAPAGVPAEAPAEEGTTAGALPFATGYDSQGRPGWIHIVVAGDTLWDISEAYLGTPWVWPSIWKDNREIENPHLIHPGDRIWITPSEMRRVSAEEAEALLAGAPAAPESTEAAEELPISAPEAAEALPDLGGAPEQRPLRRVSSLENVGLITSRELESAASIVDAIPDRVMLSQGDRVYIGLGEGEVEVDDEFAIFRTEEKVRDPDTGRLLGYHVEILGWVKVEEVHEETSVAVIRLSDAEIERGDRLVPRDPVASEIPVLESPGDVEGKLAYFAQSRTMMGMVDYVYVNRGTLDGLDVGSPLVVYRPGYVGYEAARGERVRVPERVVAQLLVVKTQPKSAVAFVTHAATELELGDHFRGAVE